MPLTGMAGKMISGSIADLGMNAKNVHDGEAMGKEINRQGEVKSLFAYCLFCKTQRCKPIAEFISKKYGYLCLSPQIIQRKWVKGTPEEEYHDWLPGYVFVYTPERIEPWFDISGIIRCLGNKELSGQDYCFADMIRQREGVIGCIPLIQEGTHCRINDPAWIGIHGRVTKLDRGRRRCCVEFTFDNVAHTVWTGYEITEKI